MLHSFRAACHHFTGPVQPIRIQRPPSTRVSENQSPERTGRDCIVRARRRSTRRSVQKLGAMSKHSELTGVAHNIAHHAGSGLSYLSPHLAQALWAAGSDTTEIDLLSKDPYPLNAAELQPLRLALASLQKTVMSLLAKQGFSDSDVSAIILHATPH